MSRGKNIWEYRGINFYLINNELKRKAEAKGVSVMIMIRTHESAIDGASDGYKRANFDRPIALENADPIKLVHRVHSSPISAS